MVIIFQQRQLFEMISQARAIPFIVKDSNDHYYLSAEAEHFLSQIKTPISVVTVAGMYRTGKSYLLNRVILNRSGGFGVGPTVNPCTKGLWLWGQPISMGGKTVLVVDTQGLGALDEESNHDMKIFCLAVLLSSNFIYNSVGSIDQNALQTLAFVLNLLSNIDKESFSCRPTFLWVVRDFTLQLVNDKGQTITPSDYLQLALSSSCTKQPQKLQIRKTITQSFTQRDCFTLIKPLIDQNKLQNLDKISPDQLRPQFISQTIQLRKLIMHSLKQIKLNNSISLQGQDYMLMCKKYLNAINNGGIPNLMDTWSYIKQERAREIVQQVRENYTDKLRNKLGNRLPMPAARLNDILNLLREEALHEFIDSTYEETPSKDICDFLTASEAEMQKLNLKQTKTAMSEILRRQFQPFQKKLMAGYYSDPTSYEQDLRNNFKATIQQKFGERFDIPLLQIELFIERKIVEGVKMFEKRARDELARTRESRSEIENALQMEIRNLNKMTDDQRRKFQEEIFEREKRIIMIENQKKRIEDTFEKTKKEDDMETGRVKRKVEELQVQGESFQRELNRIQNINSDQQRQIFFLKKQLEKEKALSKQKQQHLQAKLGEIDKRASTLQHQLNISSKNWQNQRRQILFQYESKFQNLIHETKQLKDTLHESTNHLEQQKMMVESLKRQMDLMRQKYQEQVMRYKQKFASSAKKDSRIQQDGQILKELQQQKKVNQQLVQKMREFQRRYKQSQEQLTLIRSQYDKNEAIASQRIGFQQMENQQLKAKISELNQAYQKMIDSTHYNHNSDAEINFKRQIHQVKAEHSRNIKAIETEYEQKLIQIKKQLSQTQNDKDELHLQYNLSQKRWQQKQKYLNSSIQKLKKDEQQLRRLFKDAQKGQVQSQRQKQSYYSIRVKQLQSQVQQIKKQANVQIEQILRKSEDTVSFIKQCSQKQKNNFEKRLEQERQKRQRKQKQTIQQWKNRLQEQKQHYQSIINQLQTRMNTMNNEFKEEMQAIKCDTQIKLQKLNNSALEQRMDLNKKLALLQQQIDITRVNYGTQLEEKARSYANSLESCKRQLRYECQQQIRAAKEAMDEIESRFEALKKSHRKSQQSNLLLKSQLDKEKAMAKEKQQISSRRFKEIQQRFAEELLNHTKILEENNEVHSLQTRRMNEEIQKLRGYITGFEGEREKLQMQYEQEKRTLKHKCTYMQQKNKRSKQDYEDLLQKFQTTVKSLSNQNQQKDIQKNLEESYQRMKIVYNKKLAEKEQNVNQQRRQTQEKIMRLQTQNKTLRDKLTIFQIRQTQQSSRYQPLDYTQRQQRQERQDRQFRDVRQERPLSDIRSQMDRTQNRAKRYIK